MVIIRTLLIVFEVLVSLLLIGLVLLQKSREQGLGMAFGANVGESLFGSRAGNVLTKGTVILGSIFALNTLVLGLLYAGAAQTSAEKRLEEATAQTQPAVPMGPAATTPAPGGIAPETGAAAQPGVVDLRTVAQPATPEAPVPSTGENPPPAVPATPESIPQLPELPAPPTAPGDAPTPAE